MEASSLLAPFLSTEAAVYSAGRVGMVIVD